MQEQRPSNEFLSPKDRYKQLFDQITELASKYQQISPVLRNEDRFDEDFSVVKLPDSCVFVFTTKEFNPASPGMSAGSYPNRFTFNFEAEVMSFTYIEAVPRREQGRKFSISEMDEESFRRDVIPQFSNLNNLFQYFGLPDRVEIPR